MSSTQLKSAVLCIGMHYAGIVLWELRILYQKLKAIEQPFLLFCVVNFLARLRCGAFWGHLNKNMRIGQDKCVDYAI